MTAAERTRAVWDGVLDEGPFDTSEFTVKAKADGDETVGFCSGDRGAIPLNTRPFRIPRADRCWQAVERRQWAARA